MDELLKLLSTNEIVAQIVCFLLLFFILRAMVWKKILVLLDQRRETIAAEFTQIETIKADLARIKTGYEADIAALDAVAAKKIQDAVEAAKKDGEDIRKKAYAEAERIIESSRENVRYELAKAKELLRRDVVDMVIATAKGVIGENLTGAQDEKIIEDFLQQIDDAV